jgi:hypothetical protein
LRLRKQRRNLGGRRRELQADSVNLRLTFSRTRGAGILLALTQEGPAISLRKRGTKTAGKMPAPRKSDPRIIVWLV